MDLHVVAPLASPAERAAVDSVVTPVMGPPAGQWDGGDRDAESRVTRGGHAARSHRDLLLPALHAVQDRVGYISDPALGYICRRLTVPPVDAYGVATFYALLSVTPQPAAVVHVCDDLACRLAGAEDVCRDLERELGPAGEPRAGASATWHRSPCLGQCERAPAALFTIAGDPGSRFTDGPVTTTEVLRRLTERPRGLADVEEEEDPSTAPTPHRLSVLRRSIPQAGDPGLRLLARVGRIDPTRLTDYLAHDGYRALGHAVSIGPQRVVEEVITAEVLGRGGAAFPAGRKWAAAAASPGRPKYIVCNADEAEPGTFKDRAFLEEDPFAIVEAMTIAGYVTGAEKGYLYIRGEYPLGEARMANAIEKAREAGLLGDDVMDAGFRFDIEIRRGGGAYICGEGTALYESIQGNRGEPRNKAERSTTAGLFNKPTVINNVETLANIPWIVIDGGSAYKSVGTARSTGHKLFSISGHVARPGVYETAFGITLRDLIDLAGGVPGGKTVKAALIGGASGVFVGPDRLHMPLTFEHTKEVGAALGSGAIVVFDETTDLMGILRRIAAFFRHESCGQCVPCRVGTVRQEELLARIESGRPIGTLDDELALLADLGRVMRDASICGLGQTASAAVESGIQLAGVLS